MKLSLDYMNRQDLPCLAEIDRLNAIDKAAAWQEDDFLIESREESTCVMVIRNPHSKAVGFVIYKLRSRSISIRHMGIHPKYQRLGLGKYIITNLKNKIKRYNKTHILFTTRDNALPLHLFLRSQGFIAIKIERECFADTREDGYIFRYDAEVVPVAV